MESNKIFNLLDKAIQMLDRCWEGYKPVAGVKPYEAGSCEKEMATQSDMSEVEEVIAMLDKAIKFYDPSQDRDESGKWSGSGGGGEGSGKASGGVVSDEKTQEIKNKVYESIPEEVVDGSKEGSIFNEDALNRSSPLYPRMPAGFKGGFKKDHPVREAFRQIAKFTDDSSREEPTKSNIKSSVEKLYNSLLKASDYKDDKGVFDSVVSKIKSIKDSI